MKILIAGEGPTELGGWSKEPEWRGDEPETGVLESLLRRIRADGWQIADAQVWKRIRKYRSGNHRSAETRTILGLALTAKEGGFSLLTFVRDRDRDPERADDVEEGIRQAAELFPALRVIGGVAREEIEAWILALLGDRRAEEHANPKTVLREQRGVTATPAMVQIIAEASFAAVPENAASLRRWLERATLAMGPAIGSAVD